MPWNEGGEWGPKYSARIPRAGGSLICIILARDKGRPPALEDVICIFPGEAVLQSAVISIWMGRGGAPGKIKRMRVGDCRLNRGGLATLSRNYRRSGTPFTSLSPRINSWTARGFCVARDLNPQSKENEPHLIRQILRTVKTWKRER
jgi:hypothetical protein